MADDIVLAIRNGDEWRHVPTIDDEPAHVGDVLGGIFGQCDSCGVSASFAVQKVAPNGDPLVLVCSRDVVDETYDTAGCGAIYPVYHRDQSEVVF